MEKLQYTYKGFTIFRLRLRTLELFPRTTGQLTLAAVLHQDLEQYVRDELGDEKAQALYDAGWGPWISVYFEHLTVELWPPGWL